MAHNSIFYNTGPAGVITVYLNAKLINNIVANNEGYAVQDYPYFVGPHYPDLVSNNNFFMNTAGVYKTDWATFTDVSSMETSLSYCLNNRECDPEFVPASDYLLSSSSCCIDTGMLYPPIKDDFDGERRPQGTDYDIGADEYFLGYSIPSLNTLSIFWLLILFPLQLFKLKR